MQNIQVFVVDSHQLSREGLRLLLAGETYDVTSATTSLEAALTEIEGGARPSLLIAVLQDAGETVQGALLHRIRSFVPDCKVVVIANTISPTLLSRITDWGANALLRSDMSRDILVRSLHLVMLGQEIFPASSTVQPMIAEDRAADALEIPEFRSVRRISDRESLILRNLLSGHSNKMIARELAISEATVKVHMKAVLRKLNVRNRTQAAIWAAANGFSIKSAGGSPTPAAHAQPMAAASGAEMVA